MNIYYTGGCSAGFHGENWMAQQWLPAPWKTENPVAAQSGDRMPQWSQPAADGLEDFWKATSLQSTLEV